MDDNKNPQTNHDNKKLIVFDIDETLLISSNTKFPNQQHHFTVLDGLFHVYLRPYIGHLFYTLKLMGYDYMFWSSGEQKYVDEIVTKLMNFLQDAKLEFDAPQAVWSANRCSHFSQKTLFRVMNQSMHGLDCERGSYAGSILSHFGKANKPLKKVKRSLKYPLSSILIVDDSPEKCMDNYGNSLIVRPFRGDRRDQELLRLVDCLHVLLHEPNVRTQDKRFWQFGCFSKHNNPQHQNVTFSSLILQDQTSSENTEQTEETTKPIQYLSTEGQARGDGGQRFGEMERDMLVASAFSSYVAKKKNPIFYFLLTTTTQGKTSIRIPLYTGNRGLPDFKISV